MSTCKTYGGVQTLFDNIQIEDRQVRHISNEFDPLNDVNHVHDHHQLPFKLSVSDLFWNARILPSSPKLASSAWTCLESSNICKVEAECSRR